MPKVVIYTTSECVYCKMAKKFFEKNSISYEEKDISVDNLAREEMIEKSGQMGAPVIDIGGKIIIGFDEEELSKILAAK